MGGSYPTIIEIVRSGRVGVCDRSPGHRRRWRPPIRYAWHAVRRRKQADGHRPGWRPPIRYACLMLRRPARLTHMAMKNFPYRLLVAALALVFLAGPAAPAAAQSDVAADASWPQWRGPLATGAAPDGDPPSSWSETENVRWRVEIPGFGQASPVVWGDHVFVLTAIPAGPGDDSGGGFFARLRRRFMGTVRSGDLLNFVIVALDRRNGSVVWERTAATRAAARGPAQHGKLGLGVRGDRRRGGLRLLRLARPPLLRPGRQSAVGSRFRRHADPHGLRRRGLAGAARRRDRRRLGPRGPVVRHRARQAHRRGVVAHRPGREHVVVDAARRRARRRHPGGDQRDGRRARLRLRDRRAPVGRRGG